MPLHVSSTMCSSSGGQNWIIQRLVSSHSVGGRPVHGTATYLLRCTVSKRSKFTEIVNCVHGTRLISYKKSACMFTFKLVGLRQGQTNEPLIWQPVWIFFFYWAVLVPLCSPRISHGPAWDWIRASVVRVLRLLAWAMARPWLKLSSEVQVLLSMSYVCVALRFVKHVFFLCFAGKCAEWTYSCRRHYHGNVRQIQVSLILHNFLSKHNHVWIVELNLF